ncbi:MAG: UDP-N-acetylglucosamine 1-carboxyvinyltransferase [Erysipelotrichaceae bacterium]|nr:UDP-N-acetylglucosamine 1-carboxyvinyltransferase [Erysipelotrichaceae bacterium]
MSSIVIEGNHKLSGEIAIGGAKNSAVALIPAAILCGDKVLLKNVPNISDIYALEEILSSLGVDVELGDHFISIDSSDMINDVIPCELSSKLRASYYFMGALLGKYKKVKMCFPGGCSIGQRPINLHLKGFEKLGAHVEEEDGNFTITADKLIGDDIFLDVPSVGATINIMLAAVLAGGKTVIDNAAMEPEIVDVAEFLNQMGAQISGAGTPKIEIIGVEKLHGTTYSVVPDRIEAGTYVIVASLLGKNLKVTGLIPSHIESLTSKLEEAGVKLDIGKNYVRVSRGGNYKAIDVKTMVYPGFPTDLQQPLVPFLTKCHGISHIEETIYENRFMNIPDTVKMGASIEVFDNQYASIYGKSDLVGKVVVATDLRGGASMVICGLIADGITTINNVEHILRGYEDIVGKLRKVGAHIKIVD